MDPSWSPLSSHDSADARRVRSARDRLLAGKEFCSSHVRPVVLESWRRSLACGVDPGTVAAPIVPSAEDAKDVEASSALGAAAAPVMRFLDRLLGDQSFVLLVTDRYCRTIDVRGSAAVLDECERINAVPGSEWAEDRVGTDAVALSTRLEEPIQIHWSENYAAVGERWTGNSAPVHDPGSGELLGALSIYGFEAIAHPKALEVNTDAALMVEQRLMMLEQRRRLQLFESYTEHLSRHANAPALCMNRHGIVVALSPAASTLLKISLQEAKGRAFAELPGVKIHGAALPFREISAARALEIVRGEDRLPAALLPVVRNSQLAGFILQLDAPSARTARSQKVETSWRAVHRFSDIVGESEAARRIVGDAQLVADRDCTVLITGESGTGKELVAHSIHAASPRSTGPFVALNCGGMTDELLSSELFGYEDGSFTGATRGGRIGKLELADRGTLFLDEVEAMSPRMQVHLLRFLEERRLLRVGGARPRAVDVRVLAATNVDLERLVDRRRFRKDLYYRLNEFPVAVPPLRERRSDVPAIAREILRREREDKSLSPHAVERLQRHDWPGNVRELRNVLIQAAVRAPGSVITPEDLSLPAEGATRPSFTQHASERDVLLEALRTANGNLSDAAAALGIHRVTLYRKLKRQGIQRGYR